MKKNTGDGVMGIIGAEQSQQEACHLSLGAATEIFYVLEYLVNPTLKNIGNSPVDARIGIDWGKLHLARLCPTIHEAINRR